MSCFVPCYGDPLDLHSFPTRRSSDLAIPGFLLPRVQNHRRLGPTTRDSMGGISRSDPSGDKTAGRQRSRQGAVDRKSTRLNSSHLGISYAVFCLKKKNKKSILKQQQT